MWRQKHNFQSYCNNLGKSHGDSGKGGCSGDGEKWVDSEYFLKLPLMEGLDDGIEEEESKMTEQLSE